VRRQVLRTTALAQPDAGAVKLTVSELDLDVGGGGVEEDEVDIECQQVRDGEEHRLLQGG
jgi:hypothetical protein